MIEILTKLVAYGALAAITSSPQWHLGENSTTVKPRNTGEVKATKKDLRVQTLEEYFARYNSPLVGEADTFVETADKYDLDWRFMPAIAGMESIFGRRVLYNSYNPFGWGGGYIMFDSWEEGIRTVAKSLGERSAANDRYGPEAWASIYCPPNAQNWTKGVRYFMGEIEKEYLTNLTEAGGTITAAR